jgi:hypothetical protein
MFSPPFLAGLFSLRKRNPPVFFCPCYQYSFPAKEDKDGILFYRFGDTEEKGAALFPYSYSGSL